MTLFRQTFSIHRWLWCAGTIVGLVASEPLAPCAMAVEESASPITVVALGDSITKGARPARGSKPEVRPEDTFCFLLEKQLQQVDSRATVINAGVSSNRTDQAVQRLESDVLKHEPDAVLIMFGTNDSCWDKGADGPRLPLEDYTANLRSIVERVREQGGVPIMMTPIPLGTGWGYARHPQYVKLGPNGPITPYVEACRSVADEYGIPLVDHFAAWQAEPAGAVDERTTDLCHPNAQGHRIIADAIAPVLSEALALPLVSTE